jgi:hypothetical protein
VPPPGGCLTLTHTSFLKENLLDLFFSIDNDRLSTRIYDKRDKFDFHMVNITFLYINIPT